MLSLIITLLLTLNKWLANFRRLESLHDCFHSAKETKLIWTPSERYFLCSD